MMQRLYIDGSARGMTVGCGIAIVDLNHLVEPYSSYKYMPVTESIYGEYYAMFEALRIIKERMYRIAVINTDNQHFFSMFEKTKGVFVMKKPISEVPVDLQPLINSIHSLLYTISRNSRSKLVIEKACEDKKEDVFYRNIAHYESRRYLSEVDDIYLENNDLLLHDNVKNKSKLNRLSAKTKTLKEIMDEDNVISL